MVITKKFEGMDDIIEYAYIMFNEKDNISILCDVDSMEEIKSLLDFDDYTEISINTNSEYEVYYITKFANGDGYSLFIEPAVYEGKLLENDVCTLVMDYVEEDYELYDGDFELLHFEEDDWDEEDFEDDDEDECDCCCEDESLDAELELICECIDFVLNENCPDCIANKIMDLAYKFRRIGFTDAKDYFREIIEDLD